MALLLRLPSSSAMKTMSKILSIKSVEHEADVIERTFGSAAPYRKKEIHVSKSFLNATRSALALMKVASLAYWHNKLSRVAASYAT